MTMILTCRLTRRTQSWWNLARAEVSVTERESCRWSPCARYRASLRMLILFAGFAFCFGWAKGGCCRCCCRCCCLVPRWNSVVTGWTHTHAESEREERRPTTRRLPIIRINCIRIEQRVGLTFSKGGDKSELLNRPTNASRLGPEKHGRTTTMVSGLRDRCIHISLLLRTRHAFICRTGARGSQRIRRCVLEVVERIGTMPSRCPAPNLVVALPLALALAHPPTRPLTHSVASFSIPSSIHFPPLQTMDTTLNVPPRRTRTPPSDISANSVLKSIEDILSQPLVITVKCERESCASILNVTIPTSLEAAAPPRLVVRCASCASLLKVQLPENIYVRHKASQLETVRAYQQAYQASQFPGAQLDVGTPEQQIAAAAAAGQTS